MAKPKADKAPEPTPPPREPIDCVAFTFQASKDSGFCNYRICTLFIKNGEIVHVEKSQEFATFEALARAEVLINSSLWNLSSRYNPGLYTTLGGDQARELIAKLEKQDPAALRAVQEVLP